MNASDRQPAAVADWAWKFHTLSEAVGEAVILLDPQGRIREWNRRAEEMFGHAAAAASGRDFLALVAPGHAEGGILRAGRSPPGGAKARLELVVCHPGGESFPVEVTVVADPGGGDFLLLARHRSQRACAGQLMRQNERRLDELARKQTEMEAAFTQRQKHDERLIWQLMHYDPVTGLPNRQGLRERLLQAVAEAERHGRHVALLTLGVDHFKQVNDTLGHAIGDYLLTTIASRLAECVGLLDNVARLGGDEFAIVLPDLTHGGAAAEMAPRLLAAVAEPIAVADHELVLRAGVGIAVFPEHGTDPDSLLRNADAAMSLAKAEGHGRWQSYSPDLNARALKRLALEEDLRRALERGELEVHYQPQIDLRTGLIDGAEALVRWRHPVHGQVPPARFIPLAEETGLIIPIGEWVLRTACAQLQAWQAGGAKDLRMAVNLSVRQFRPDELGRSVRGILAGSGIRPECLELEITESMLMHDTERGIAILRELKDLGVQLAIDDFGTGYSSLNYLKLFPIDTLKIDQSFVRQIPGDGNDKAIVRAVIALAQCLRLKVVAEGVETEKQLRFMYQQGCDKVQGYLFSPPVEAARFAALLAEERLPPAAGDAAPIDPAAWPSR